MVAVETVEDRNAGQPLPLEFKTHRITDMRKAKTKKKGPIAWSERKLNLLKRLYPSRTAQEIAEQLGRSVPATRFRINKLGLKKKLRYEDSHRVVNGTREKLCRKCRKWKDESQFCGDRNSKDGLGGWCKKCFIAAGRKRRLAVNK